MHRLPPPRPVVVAVLLLVAALAAGCGSSPGPGEASPAPASATVPAPAASVAVDPGPLAVVTLRGGECPEGACEQRTVIERDGTFYWTAPKRLPLGQAAPEVIAALEDAIARTNFDLLRSRPFLGECPTAFDGQETVYEFAAPWGVERVASCETAIDPSHPLFHAVDAVLGSVTGG